MSRTAIIFIHGQGQQRPMDSVRALATSAWASDPDHGASEEKRKAGYRYWSIPDERSDTYEMHRLATERDGNGRRFDFYEYYWAHLMTDTAFSHVWSWFSRLVKRNPREVPNPLLRVRQIILRSLEMAIAFGIVAMALCIYFLSGVPAERPTGTLTSWVFNLIVEHSLLIALFIAPLFGTMAIIGDWIRTSFWSVGEPSFNPAQLQRNTILAIAAATVPLLGLQISYESEFTPALQDVLCVFLIISTALWFVRFLVAGVLVAGVGLFVGLAGVFLTDISCFVTDATTFAPPSLTFLLAPIIVSAMTGGAFRAASLRVSYVWSVLVALLVCFATFATFHVFDFLSYTEQNVPAIAALAAAWVIAMAVLLPEAARFNRANLAADETPWRRGHRTQLSMLAFVATAPIVLVQDPVFNRMNMFEAFFGFSRANGVVGLPWVLFIPLLYASAWFIAVRTTPKLKASEAAKRDCSPEMPPPTGFLLLHIALWLAWSIYFYTALSKGGEWAAYWMFTASLLAIPTLIVIGIAANRTFIVPVMGDSARYLSPTPENILARQKIRETGVALLESLHRDGAYDRIIVVAHSLGSVVAYDILSQLWARHVDALHHEDVADALEDVQRAADRLQNLDGVDEAEVAERRNTFRRKQADYRLAIKDIEVPTSKDATGVTYAWRISDFVTMGSPLTYAPTLLADSDGEFARRQAKLELPACPPDRRSVKDENEFGDREGVFAYLKSSKSYLGAKHSAIFSAVRWSNLFFATPGLVTGDLIGGPLQDHFGRGVEDHEIRSRPSGVSFAHNEYWKWFPTPESRDDPGSVSRHDLKPEDTPEHIKALRAAMNLSDDT